MTKYTPSPEEVEREAHKIDKLINGKYYFPGIVITHTDKFIAKHVLIQRYEAAERMREECLFSISNVESDNFALIQNQHDKCLAIMHIEAIEEAIRNIDPKEVL